MNKFYERIIKQSDEKIAKDKEREKRQSLLLEIKDERAIPKLRFKKRRKRRGVKVEVCPHGGSNG
jgi:hypothetical protein